MLPTPFEVIVADRLTAVNPYGNLGRSAVGRRSLCVSSRFYPVLDGILTQVVSVRIVSLVVYQEGPTR
jgi:hypothetical protein